MGDSQVKRRKNKVSGVDVASFVETHNGGACCFGLDEWTHVSEVWSKVVDKEEKRELKERLRTLKMLI